MMMDPFSAAGWSRQTDMLRRLGQLTEAKAAYCAALQLTKNNSERLYLERRIGECDSHTPA